MRIFRSPFSVTLLAFSAVVVFSLAFFFGAAADTGAEVQDFLKRMEAAYARVEDYRARIEVTTYEKKGADETKRFLYTFKKPNRIRLDFESPHPGLVLSYPDPKGRVVVRPSSWVPFFRLPLAPDSSLLLDSSGQRVDQTDLGSLIQHIAHSLTDQRRGPVGITYENGRIRLQVPADNPFRAGSVTLYQFFIDTTLFLPVKVKESTLDGSLQRIITFEGLSINTGVADGFFQVE
jgi:outer membrane lipoprotein-sorting protein